MIRAASVPLGRALRYSRSVLAGVCATGLFLATVSLGLCLTKKIEINDNGKIINATAAGCTVGEVLQKNGITLLSDDSVSPPLTEKALGRITIARAKPFTIIIRGTEKTVWTTNTTVKDILSHAGVTLGQKDLVEPPLESTVEQNAVIKVTGVEEVTLTETQPIPFDTVSKPNFNLNKGVTRVAKEGVQGIKELMYKTVTHDGVEQSRELIGEKIVKQPESRVIEYGVLSVKSYSFERTGNLTSRGDLRYRRVLPCVATAYDNSGGNGRGITASGMRTRPGVVAVDPGLIPLGSKLYIESTDGSPDYGYAIAADTGSAIKGNKIDLYMETRSECLRWGKRKVNVYVLDD